MDLQYTRTLCINNNCSPLKKISAVYLQGVGAILELHEMRKTRERER